MKVFMIGGTGLLGSEGAKELVARGHDVSSIALPPVPEGAQLPPEMKLTLGNFMEMSDAELKKQMKGCEGFVFAAGVDERMEGPAPIYDMFKKFNITPLERLLRIAKECGVKRAVVCGSYFTYFAKIWPKLHLTRWHPYIRSRADHVITCSHYMREHVCDIYGIDEDQVSVIPNGIDPMDLQPVDDLETLRARFAAPDEKLVLLVGRLVYEKGFQLALDALEQECGLLLHPLAIEHRQRLAWLSRQEPRLATDVRLGKVEGGHQWNGKRAFNMNIDAAPRLLIGRRIAPA